MGRGNVQDGGPRGSTVKMRLIDRLRRCARPRACLVFAPLVLAMGCSQTRVGYGMYFLERASRAEESNAGYLERVVRDTIGVTAPGDATVRPAALEPPKQPR